MGWRFRKSFSPIPGVRVTLSPRGLSTSVGVGHFRLSASPSGSAFSATIPGTGLSFRQPLGGGPAGNRGGGALPFDPTGGQQAMPVPAPVSYPEPTIGTSLQEIKSAGSAGLTTPGLEAFRKVLEQARKEHAIVVRDLSESKHNENAAVTKFRSWENGWLLRRIFTSKFQQLGNAAEEMTDRRKELQEQEQLSRLQTQMELPESVKQTFHALCDEFDKLARSQKIWDTVGHRSTNQVAERTSASRVIDRKPVNFRLGSCEVIEFDLKVPHLENANGGDLFLYPAFVLYFVTSTSFALLEYKDVQIAFNYSRFIEEEPIPSDSKVLGRTWAKTNKDGSPDRRFKDNYEIPIAQYGKLVFRSGTGMNEEYMTSNAEQAEAFAAAWERMVKAVAAGV